MAKRKRPKLTGTKGMLNRLGVQEREVKDLKTDLTELLIQVEVAKKIISENMQIVNKLAEKDVKVGQLLEDISELSNAKATDKALKGKKVGQRGSQLLLDLLAKIDEGFTHLNELLAGGDDDIETDLSEIIQQLSTLVNNDQLDQGVRSQTLGYIQNLVDSQNLSNQVSKDLLQVQTQDLNFSKDQADGISDLLSNAARDTTDVKIKGSLDRLNETMEDLVTEQQESKSFSERFAGLREAGASGLSKALEGKDKAFGVLDIVGPMVGLPGLGTLLGEGMDLGSLAMGGFGLGKIAQSAGGMAGKAIGGVGSLAKKGGVGIGKTASKFTSVMGKITPMLMKFGKMALRLAGPLGLVATAAMAVHDALEPFADMLFDKLDIFGTKEKDKKSESNNDLKMLLATATRRTKGTQLTAGQLDEVASGMSERLKSGKSTLEEEVAAFTLNTNPELSLEEAKAQAAKLVKESQTKGTNLFKSMAKMQSQDMSASKRRSQVDKMKEDLYSFSNLASDSLQNVASGLTMGLVEAPTAITQQVANVESKVMGSGQAEPTLFDKISSGSFDVSKALSSEEGAAGLASQLKGFLSSQMKLITTMSAQPANKNNAVVRDLGGRDPEINSINGNI